MSEVCVGGRKQLGEGEKPWEKPRCIIFNYAIMCITFLAMDSITGDLSLLVLWNHLQNSLFATGCMYLPTANKQIQTFFDATRRAQIWLETPSSHSSLLSHIQLQIRRLKKDTTTSWHNLFFFPNNNLSNNITPNSTDKKNLLCLNTNQAYWKASNAFANLFSL